MLRYPVKLTKDDNYTLLVTAPDLPEVATFGKNEADAVRRARDAIATAAGPHLGSQGHPRTFRT